MEDSNDSDTSESTTLFPTTIKQEPTVKESALVKIELPNNVLRRALPIEQAFLILEDAAKKHMAGRVVPLLPKVGDLILVDEEKMGDKWAEDGFDWQSKERSVPWKVGDSDQPLIQRSHFVSTKCDIFVKTVYQLLKTPNIMLIHYYQAEVDTKKDQLEGIIPSLSTTKATAHFRRFKKNVDKDPVNKPLDYEEAVDILEHYKGQISEGRPLKPKGGEIYMFNTDTIGEDWKCDDYIWRNSGSSYVPSKNPILKKTFFNIRTAKSGEKGSREFQKIAFSLVSRPNIILTQYIGNEGVYTPRLHGNRKNGGVEHKRTCPSVIAAIKSMSDADALTVYDSLSASGVAKPRNIQQIRNALQRMRPQQMPSKRKQDNSDDTTASPAKQQRVEEDFSRYLQELPSGILLEAQQVPAEANQAVMEVIQVQESAEQQNTGLEIKHPERHLATGRDQGLVELNIEQEGRVLSEMGGNESKILVSQDNAQTVHGVMTEGEKDNGQTEVYIELIKQPEIEHGQGDSEGHEFHDDGRKESQDSEQEEIYELPEVEKTPSTVPQSSDNTTSIQVEKLDSRPEVRSLQMEILNQQKLNLKLQRTKLELEMEKLDDRPDVRSLQMEVLEQQRLNLQLQEAKLNLEIEKVERENEDKQEQTAIVSETSGNTVQEIDLSSEVLYAVDSEGNAIEDAQLVYALAGENAMQVTNTDDTQIVYTDINTGSESVKTAQVLDSATAGDGYQIVFTEEGSVLSTEEGQPQRVYAMNDETEHKIVIIQDGKIIDVQNEAVNQEGVIFVQDEDAE